MNPINKKVVGGMIALLFIVSIVNTQAIIKIAKAGNVNNAIAMAPSDSQAAASGIAVSCIQILPSTENRASFIDPDMTWGTLSFAHEFVYGFKIHNKCTYGISIIHDSIGLNPSVSPSAFTNLIPIIKLQDWPDLGNVSTANGTYFFFGPTPIDTGTISNHQSADIDIPYAAFQGVPSSHNPDYPNNNHQWVYNIPASGDREFEFDGIIMTSTDTNFPTHYTRIMLNKLRWFKTINYTSDTVLTSDEVKTFTFPVGTYVSSFAKFEYPTTNMQTGGTRAPASNFSSLINSFIEKETSLNK